MKNPSSSDELNFFEVLSYVERLHRRLLDLVKEEVGRLNFRNINAVQALLVFNISDTEMTVGELRSRGRYLGSNVSYNLKKLIEGGYVEACASPSDRRVTCVKLTSKGKSVARAVSALYRANLGCLVDEAHLEVKDLEVARRMFRKIEMYWNNSTRRI